jgi:hypothetical protein
MIQSETPATGKTVALAEQKVVPRLKRAPVRGPRIQAGSREAKRRAAAILEVLGGARVPSDAAAALGISVPRYYLLESQGLNGLLAACEPRPTGRVRSVETDLAAAQKQIVRLKQEAARWAALARVAQRTVGLPQPVPAKTKPGAKKRKHRPTVRALKAVQVLQSDSPGETEAVLAGEQPAEG